MKGNLSLEGGAWSLDQELCQLAGASRLELAVDRLRILTPGVSFAEIRPLGNLHRGGSETYLFHFLILGTSGWQKRLLLKAVVLFSGIPLWEVAQKWMDRRQLLLAEGVSVPKVYAME